MHCSTQSQQRDLCFKQKLTYRLRPVRLFVVTFLKKKKKHKETVDVNAFPRALFFQKCCGTEERWEEKQFRSATI